ncbi:hypothetical protein FS749_000461 [Ceratobasidium sp. UAMH 11750]|nr:hypothetical protein FS749_000461 [Ceratobasidium sp. UAMH 11750]
MPRIYSCPRCPQEFDTKKDLKAHKKEHGQLVRGPSSPRLNPSGPSTKRFSCPHCRQQFMRHSNLVKHLQDVPSCPEQRRKLISAPRANRSSEVANPNAICPYCKTGFNKSSGLSKHLRTHSVCSVSHDACSNVPTAGSPPSPTPPIAASSTPTSPNPPPRISPRSSPSLDDLNIARMSLEDDTMRDQGADIPNPVVNDLVEEIHVEPDAEYRVYVENYPVRTVGEPIRQATEGEMGPTEYPDVGALADPENFEVGHVLLTSNMSGADRERFLRLKKFRKNAPWKRNRQLMRDVDKLPHGPGWSVETKELQGDKGTTELVEFWKRDSLEWVKKIVRDKQLGPYLHLKPQRHYTNSRRTKRRRGEMWTGDLMWKFQDMVDDPQGTVIPYIISSDETHLSTFSGDKKAHPVYLTLGNIPKRIRRRISSRATVLIGYLPIPKLDIIKNQDQRRSVKRELFHRCMETLLAPLVEASKGGVEVPFFDGGVRKIYCTRKITAVLT